MALVSGYVVSFTTIGALWLAHTTMTEYLERADMRHCCISRSPADRDPRRTG